MSITEAEATALAVQMHEFETVHAPNRAWVYLSLDEQRAKIHEARRLIFVLRTLGVLK